MNQFSMQDYYENHLALRQNVQMRVANMLDEQCFTVVTV